MATKPTKTPNPTRKSKPRPPTPADRAYEARRVRTGERMTLWLEPEDLETIRARALDGETRSQTIRRLIRQRVTS